MGKKPYDVSFYPVAFSPLEPDLMIWSGKGYLHGCFLESGHHFHIPINETEIDVFCLHPSQPLIYVSAQGQIDAYDFNIQKQVRVYSSLDSSSCFYNYPRDLRIDSQGKWLGLCTDCSVMVWDLQSGKMIQELKNESLNCFVNLCFIPDKNLLAVTYPEFICFWDTYTWQEIHHLPMNYFSFLDGSFSHDNPSQLLYCQNQNRLIASGSWTLFMWDVAEPFAFRQVGFKDSILNSKLALSYNEHYLLIARVTFTRLSRDREERLNLKQKVKESYVKSEIQQRI